jgi:hypothetical protein
MFTLGVTIRQGPGGKLDKQLNLIVREEIRQEPILTSSHSEVSAMPKPSVNIDECLFFRGNIINLDAALISISRGNWQSIPEESASPKSAIEVMKEQRFDVLPIVSGERVTGYFQTSRWNDYSPPVRKSLCYKDVIPAQTSVRDLVKSFAIDDRQFYFLSNENRIAGLVTVADLNSRQVRTYLYHLFCELEIGLGGFLSKYVSEKELLEMTVEGFRGKRYETTKRHFKKDRNGGVEVRFVEYLYLSDLFTIILKNGLHDNLGYSESEFIEKLCSLNNLRTVVAHPNRSIITRASTVKSLWKRIDCLDDALFRLRQEMECVVSR